MQKILVVSGTQTDATLGANLLKENGFDSVLCPISENPYQQTLLQNNPKLLFETVVEKINLIIKKEHIEDAIVFIYCNSLSVAIDLEKLSKNTHAKIITPLDAYIDAIKAHDHIALLASSTKSAGSIEAFLYEKCPNLKFVNGLGCLDLVCDIEKGLTQEAILEKHKLVEQIEIFYQRNVRVVLLACTHFHYFYQKLQEILVNKKIKMQLIDPSFDMIKMLSSIRQAA